MPNNLSANVVKPNSLNTVVLTPPIYPLMLMSKLPSPQYPKMANTFLVKISFSSSFNCIFTTVFLILSITSKLRLGFLESRNLGNEFLS